MRILVVEDEGKVAQSIRDALSKGEFAVDLASDGASALGRVNATAYDLLILDVMLPDRDGFSVCREMRALGLKSPILMLSARSLVDDRVRGLDSGADDYLTKPFEVTELDALVTTLNQLLDRLQRAFASLRQFAGDVSHQIQTPLTVIKGALDVALQEPSRSGDPAWLEGLAEEVEGIRAIVVDLRTLALADAPIASATSVDLTHVVDETCEIVAALGELRHVRVRCTAEADVTVRGDATRLKQVVLNLGDNAVKYTPAGGNVRIDLETADDRAMLRITDTGIGIPEEYLPRLFDRLFRTESAGQRAEGTGLGLAIAKRIVEAHGGTIEVHSRVGAGSTFTVSLPRA